MQHSTVQANVIHFALDVIPGFRRAIPHPTQKRTVLVEWADHSRHEVPAVGSAIGKYIRLCLTQAKDNKVI